MARNPIQFQKGLSMPDFLAAYGTDEQCRLALEQARWPDGFVCPHCGGRKSSFHSTRKLYRCSNCGVQTSVRAGTILHHSKLPLSKWFLAMYAITQAKNSISGLALSRLLGVQYNTARLLKLKLSQVMLERNETKVLGGRVEIDDAYLGGERSGGKAGRGSENKRPFVAAVETREGRPQRVHFRRVAAFSREEIAAYAKASLAAGTHVVSDGLACFAGVTEAACSHDVIVTSRIHQAQRLSAFKWVNTLLGNLKTSISGTLKATRDRHMARYLAEFEYRFNRRFDLGAMIPRLAFAAVNTGPRPYRWLVPEEIYA